MGHDPGSRGWDGRLRPSWITRRDRYGSMGRWRPRDRCPRIRGARGYPSTGWPRGSAIVGVGGAIAIEGTAGSGGSGGIGVAAQGDQGAITFSRDRARRVQLVWGRDHREGSEERHRDAGVRYRNHVKGVRYAPVVGRDAKTVIKNETANTFTIWMAATQRKPPPRLGSSSTRELDQGAVRSAGHLGCATPPIDGGTTMRGADSRDWFSSSGSRWDS